MAIFSRCFISVWVLHRGRISFASLSDDDALPTPENSGIFSVVRNSDSGTAERRNHDLYLRESIGIAIGRSQNLHDRWINLSRSTTDEIFAEFHFKVVSRLCYFASSDNFRQMHHKIRRRNIYVIFRASISLLPFYPFVHHNLHALSSDDLRVLKYELPIPRRFSFATKRFIRFTVIAFVVHFYAARLKFWHATEHLSSSVVEMKLLRSMSTNGTLARILDRTYRAKWCVQD